MKYYLNVETENSIPMEFDSFDEMAKHLKKYDEECGTVTITVKPPCYSAILYKENFIDVIDEQMFPNKNEAIVFATLYDFDEVMDNNTGEVVWTRV